MDDTTAQRVANLRFALNRLWMQLAELADPILRALSKIQRAAAEEAEDV